jgi:acetyl esterase/lipase
MARLTRRGFVKASGALAVVPALTALSLRAQGQAPDTGNLRVEKDIVFGKGGDKDLTLDVYRPPQGVTSKRLAIVHLFGGGFFVGNKKAGYIINDAKALGARGYTSVSANYRLQSEGLWPAQIHDTKAAIRWTRANADRPLPGIVGQHLRGIARGVTRDAEQHEVSPVWAAGGWGA